MVGVPVALQCHGARLTSVATDVGFVRYASVRRLTGLGECRRFIAHRRHLDSRPGRHQKPPDLALDFVVAPLSDPSPHQSPRSSKRYFAGHASFPNARQMTKSLSIAIG